MVSHPQPASTEFGGVHSSGVRFRRVVTFTFASYKSAMFVLCRGWRIDFGFRFHASVYTKVISALVRAQGYHYSEVHFPLSPVGRRSRPGCFFESS